MADDIPLLDMSDTGVIDMNPIPVRPPDHAPSTSHPTRLHINTTNCTPTPRMLSIGHDEYGTILVLFRVPAEATVSDAAWVEQMGMEAHAWFTGCDYAHCEIHFEQSDVGLSCGSDPDVDGVVFLWNKQYNPKIYDCVYRIKLKTHKYNELLRWSIEKVDARPTYDRAYMYAYCWLCWCRHMLPLSWSMSRQNKYTCASLTYSTLAVAGLTDVPRDIGSVLIRGARKEEMVKDRMVTIQDVVELIEGTATGQYSTSTDVLEVERLASIPHRLSMKPKKNKTNVQ